MLLNVAGDQVHFIPAKTLTLGGTLAFVGSVSSTSRWLLHVSYGANHVAFFCGGLAVVFQPCFHTCLRKPKCFSPELC